MSSTDTIQPHDPDTLYRLAWRAVKTLGVPDRWREDAVAEYVMAAYEAGIQTDHPVNVQTRQYIRGRDAALKFHRRERRQEALSPGSCIVGAKRVSIDKTILLRDGEQARMSETIKDPNMPQPDALMLRNEQSGAMRRVFEELDSAAREAVKQVWLEERTQEAAAETLGLSRQGIQRILDQARIYLRERLKAHENACKGTRFKKKRQKKIFSGQKRIVREI